MKNCTNCIDHPNIKCGDTYSHIFAGKTSYYIVIDTKDGKRLYNLGDGCLWSYKSLFAKYERFFHKVNLCFTEEK